MQESKPLFIADSCIGGLSVIKALRDAGIAGDAIFLADYEINPLGVKSDSEISAVVRKWLTLAEQQSDTLFIACNTLSIRFRQLMRYRSLPASLKRVVSMVDCFEAMVKAEKENLDNKRILVIGTAFTASQPLYTDILQEHIPGCRISSIAATDLERKIARFQLNEDGNAPTLTPELEKALDNADIAILACTCFPMVKTALESLFPQVLLVDPGAYCSSLVEQHDIKQGNKLTIEVTGDVASRERVSEFAKSYLGPGLQVY